MGSAWPFRRELLLSVVIPVVGQGDSPSSWAPPLGEGVISGLTLAPRSLLVDELRVTTPRVVGDAVAYGLAVAVARGPGDTAVGRGEAVAAGGALWVWAESIRLPHPQRRALLQTEGTFSQPIKIHLKVIEPPKKSPQMWKQVAKR